MKIIIYLILLTPLLVNAQTIYSKSYGKKSNPTIIFIHGGPGGNSTLFESTTAKCLAEKGFYVIVYDRRGEGRSFDVNATFTFNEAFNDLNDIYKEYKIKKANILAHSFGGIVSVLFADKYPEKIKSIILTDALLSQQETYDHILNTSKIIYEKECDTLMLNKISEIKTLSKNSYEYRKMCYEIAEINNFFNMPRLEKRALELNSQYEQSHFHKNNIRNTNAPIIFFQNEYLNNIDIKDCLQKIKAKNISLFAIYGKQDGIFSKKQLDDLKELVGKKRFILIDNCSHYPFVDQQDIFLYYVQKWLAKL